MVDGAPDRFRFLEGLQGLIDAASKATGVESPRVAICGQCVGVLCAKGDLETAVAIEKSGNDLVKAYDVDILCAYALPRWREVGYLKTLRTAEPYALVGGPPRGAGRTRPPGGPRNVPLVGPNGRSCLAFVVVQ
jgi:hypothetical protein